MDRYQNDDQDHLIPVATAMLEKMEAEENGAPVEQIARAPEVSPQVDTPTPVAEEPKADPEKDLLPEQLALARKIKIVQPGEFFSEDAIQKLLVQTLRADTLEHVAIGKDAFWLVTSHFELDRTSHYCWAILGLTEAPPKRRSARFPQFRSTGATRVVEEGSWSVENNRDCRSNAVRSALGAFAKAELSEQLAGIDATRGSGGVRPHEARDKGMVNMRRTGTSDASVQRVADAVPVDFFDYRKLSWMVFSETFRFGDQVVCLATVGVSARAPSERALRFPGKWYSQLWQMTPEQSGLEGAEAKCKDDAAVAAMENAVADSWDEKGLLAGFEFTREDGLPLVKPIRRKAAPVASAIAKTSAGPKRLGSLNAALRASGQCQPPAGRTLRYSDRCFNGDCVRTFGNGCSVRFQAPYCYDMMSGSWEWKPDGC